MMIYLIRISKIIALLLVCLTTIVIVTYGQPSKATLAPEEIDGIASQTTVLIAQDLKENDLEARKEYDPGSGVIVAKNGNTYFALTNNHVVKTLKPRVKWGVRTWDGEVHRITDGQDIIRFGEFQDQSTPIKGFDLALVRFQSDKNYYRANIGKSESLKISDQVLVSGWPKPPDNSPKRNRESKQGKIAKVSDNIDKSDGGYGILYSNDTRPGMSGGPVFNDNGELVGIHGRGRKKGDLYCVDIELNTNNSCGIKFSDFITEAERKQIQLVYDYSPVEPRKIEVGKRNKPKADRIDNIFQLFSPEGGLKEDPFNCKFLDTCNY